MEEKLEMIRGWMALADEKIEVAQKLLDLSYYDKEELCKVMNNL